VEMVLDFCVGRDRGRESWSVIEEIDTNQRVLKVVRVWMCRFARSVTLYKSSRAHCRARLSRHAETPFN
jgi:hypothetical protein